MKKNYLSFLICAIFFSFATLSCADSAVDEPVVEEQEEEVEPEEEEEEEEVIPVISVSLVEATHKSIIVSTDPDSYEGAYYVACVSFDEYDDYMDGSKDPLVLAEALILAEIQLGTDLRVVDDIWVFSGAMDAIEMADGWDVDPSTSYYICAFPIDGKYGEIVGDVTMLKVDTTSPPMNTDISFELSVTDITASGATVNIVPNDDTQRYFFSVYDLFTYQRYSDNDDEFYHFMELVILGCVDLDTFTTRGATSATYTALSEDSDYVLIAFAIDDEYNPYSTMYTKTFYTLKETEEEAGDKPDMPAGAADDFTINIVEITSSDIVIEVDTNGYEGNYIADATTYSQFESDYADLAEFGMTLAWWYAYCGVDFSVADNENIFSGNQTINLGASGSMRADTYYIITVFGVDPTVSSTQAVCTGISVAIEKTDAAS